MHNNILAGLRYILYFTLKSKIIIVGLGLHIITSRHVLIYIYLLLKYAWPTFRCISANTIRCRPTPAVLPHCSSQHDAYGA